MAPCPLKDQLFLAVLKLTVRKALATLKKLRFVFKASMEERICFKDICVFINIFKWFIIGKADISQKCSRHLIMLITQGDKTQK